MFKITKTENKCYNNYMRGQHNEENIILTRTSHSTNSFSLSKIKLEPYETKIVDNYVIKHKPKNHQFIKTYFQNKQFKYVPYYITENEQYQVMSLIEGQTINEKDLTLQQIKETGEILKQTHNYFLQTTGKQIIHGDLGPHNIIFKNQKINGIIDWTESKEGNVEEDLGNMLWHLINEHWQKEPAEKITPKIKAFLEGYKTNLKPTNLLKKSIKKQIEKETIFKNQENETQKYFLEMLQWITKNKTKIDF